MCARHLLNAGTQPDARDIHGESPLHYACERGSAECVEILLRAAAEVGAEDGDQSTPLHVACSKGRVECVRLLLGSGDIGVACARLSFFISRLNCAGVASSPSVVNSPPPTWKMWKGTPLPMTRNGYKTKSFCF